MLVYAAVACTLACVAAQAWTVSAGRIHDESGSPVTLRGINWSGFETATLAPHGLWTRNLGDMLDQMQSLGFNAIRIPICPLVLHGAPVQGIDYDLNPDLRGLNSLQVLDTVAAEAQRRGLRFLLDHDRPDCESVAELWYTPAYTEAQWIADLEFMARRYGSMDAFLGLDLKNEPHGSASWGSNDTATDWRLAAERAAHAVLAIAPKALVFVGGIAGGASCGARHAASWWGGSIAAQLCAPLNIPSQRLVLAPHLYGPDVQAKSYFGAAEFPANMPAIWEADFGLVRLQGYAVAIGETGGDFGRREPTDKPLQQHLFAYLKRSGVQDLFYWSWTPNSSDTGGVLDDDWLSVREDKMELLREFWDLPPRPGAPGRAAWRD